MPQSIKIDTLSTSLNWWNLTPPNLGYDSDQWTPEWYINVSPFIIKKNLSIKKLKEKDSLPKTKTGRHHLRRFPFFLDFLTSLKLSPSLYRKSETYINYTHTAVSSCLCQYLSLKKLQDEYTTTLLTNLPCHLSSVPLFIHL